MTEISPVFNLTGDFDHPLAASVKKAFDDALDNKHKLNEFIASMEGMSGQIYRKFVNNLIANVENCRYLETGSLKGSTSCAAMFRNKLKVKCIENWHWNYRDQFINNTNAVRTDSINFELIEKDFRSVDYRDIGKFNVYMFDGPHSARDQYDGVFLAQPALDDVHILIVDDWNWHDVQKGTWSAIKFLENKVVASLEILTTTDGSYPKIADHYSDWHNGYFVAVIEKSQRAII